MSIVRYRDSVVLLFASNKKQWKQKETMFFQLESKDTIFSNILTKFEVIPTIIRDFIVLLSFGLFEGNKDFVKKFTTTFSKIAIV